MPKLKDKFKDAIWHGVNPPKKFSEMSEDEINEIYNEGTKHLFEPEHAKQAKPKTARQTKK